MAYMKIVIHKIILNTALSLTYLKAKQLLEMKLKRYKKMTLRRFERVKWAKERDFTRFSVGHVQKGFLQDR